jgi:hypothetical protein
MNLKISFANGIRDRIARKWIIRLASANNVHVEMPRNKQ